MILGNNNGFAGVPNANWEIDGDGALRIFWNHELNLAGLPISATTSGIIWRLCATRPRASSERTSTAMRSH